MQLIIFNAGLPTVNWYIGSCRSGLRFNTNEGDLMKNLLWLFNGYLRRSFYVPLAGRLK